MFQRLAEAFQDSHYEYLDKQTPYFTSLPNINLSATSGLNFKTAVQSVEPQLNEYQPTFNKYPNDIFMGSNQGLEKLAKECASSSLDKLIGDNNQNAIRCGWLYTPSENNPYPKLSKGAIGDSSGPIETYLPNAEYKKWFFDLQLAKKQILIDKCKALRSCEDVNSEVFKDCGYCTDTNQGIPVTNGKPIYRGDPLGTCSSDPITKQKDCPVVVVNGPQPVTDRTCEPINGRLSTACLRNQVLNGGCSNNGSLAIALSGSNYISDIINGDAVKIYRETYPLSSFIEGNTTVQTALEEVRQLYSSTVSQQNSGHVAAARDLCLQAGTIKSYDFCSDLQDTTAPPFNIACLQNIFKRFGGQQNGTSYPSDKNIAAYNSMNNLGEVKRYFNKLIDNMNSTRYDIQRDALMRFLGIKIENTVKRAPFKQGVEVFWFVQVPWQANRVSGFLRRTIEPDFIQLGGGSQLNPSHVGPIVLASQNVLGFSQYANMIQLTDVRTQTDFGLTFDVKIDDGFFISINQPAGSDAKILADALNRTIDTPGVFANIGAQGTTPYNSKACSTFKASMPNITKMFYEDCGGGGHYFTYTTNVCNGTSSFNSSNYSLTCEERAPFLNFEVNSVFEETRNPGMFSQFIQLSGLDYHTRFEERYSVPGKKSFARFNTSNSYINLPNIAYQSWKTFTLAVRLKSSIVNDETLVTFTSDNYVYKIIANRTTGRIYISNSFNNNGNVNTPYVLTNDWNLIIVKNNGNSFSLYCDSISTLISTKGNTSYTVVTAPNVIFPPNGTSGSTSGQRYSNAKIMIGRKNFASLCVYDVAWVHFFDKEVTGNDIYRDCMANWVFTQFPDSPGTYTPSI